MYKYLVGFVLLTPLAGIWMVESGEYGASIGVYGYENGATEAFAAYALIVSLVAWVSRGRSGVLQRPWHRSHADAALIAFGSNLLVVSTVFLVVFLFGFGAIRVWTGGVGKGEFRATLGPLGALPNLMTKFVLPALLAYAAALYRRSSRRKAQRRLLGANFVLVFIIGASWGFKSTAMFVLVPALLILYWRMRPVVLIVMVLAFVVTIVSFFFLFDADVEEYADAQTFLFRRVTVLQGDVSWLIWDRYRAGEVFPAYAPTLLAGIGDSMLSISGLTRDDYYNWTLHHYDLLITYLAGAPLDQIAEGHTITGTPFSEGLVAGGMGGVFFFAVLAGLIVGRMYAFIQRALARGLDQHAALGVTYFSFNVFTWLNGGAVVQLFHVSVLLSLAVTVLAFRLMRILDLNSVVKAKPA